MKPVALSSPTSNLIRWFAPDEDIDMILSGPCGARVQEIARELRRVDCFLRANIDPPTRVLLSGPSGTGKTMAARWIARRLGVPLALVDVSRVIGKYLGESAKNLSDVFAAASQVEGAMLFLDEIDAICTRRSADGDSNTGADDERERVTTTFFQQVDWLEPSRVVFAATNYADKLDPALRRRLTTEVVFAPPDRDGRRRMLDLWLAKAPIPSETIDKLADDTEGLAGADLRSRAMEMARRAIMATPEPPPRPREAAPPRLRAVEAPVQRSLADVPDVTFHRVARPRAVRPFDDQRLPSIEDRAVDSLELSKKLLASLETSLEKKTETPSQKKGTGT